MVDEEGRRLGRPRVRAIGALGIPFNFLQVALRFTSLLFEVGSLAFIAWLYNHWRREESARVDFLFPSFFPMGIAVLVDAYEFVSLLWLHRTRAINPIAIGFDVALTGAGVFCFSILNMVDARPRWNFNRPDRKHESWVLDMRNAMIFMIVFSIMHAAFVVMTAAGVVKMYISLEKSRKAKLLAQAQLDMLQFTGEIRHDKRSDAAVVTELTPEPPQAVHLSPSRGP
ncbi:hypothetical protein QBC40DRAFT_280663 [Triangularia verruculosa]|uniref:Uncharacterized protein n=1 Tax=Triangularia verruculosa TaxID=2587418 RepID=A0AAN7AT00_9PEZI|nr:hypothetical protein QBC40DRAFT_280663 [Triangularia verruculosa]